MKGEKIYGITYEEIVTDYNDDDNVYEIYHTDVKRTEDKVIALFDDYYNADTFFEKLEPSSVVMGDTIIITAYNLIEYHNYDDGDYNEFECIEFKYEELK